MRVSPFQRVCHATSTHFHHYCFVDKLGLFQLIFRKRSTKHPFVFALVDIKNNRGSVLCSGQTVVYFVCMKCMYKLLIPGVLVLYTGTLTCCYSYMPDKNLYSHLVDSKCYHTTVALMRLYRLQREANVALNRTLLYSCRISKRSFIAAAAAAGKVAYGQTATVFTFTSLLFIATTGIREVKIKTKSYTATSVSNDK